MGVRVRLPSAAPLFESPESLYRKGFGDLYFVMMKFLNIYPK